MAIHITNLNAENATKNNNTPLIAQKIITALNAIKRNSTTFELFINGFFRILEMAIQIIQQNSMVIDLILYKFIILGDHDPKTLGTMDVEMLGNLDKSIV